MTLTTDPARAGADENARADEKPEGSGPTRVAPSPQLVKRRMRALIGFSMLAVVPAFVFSIGTLATVITAQGATVSYEQKDWDGSAAWSRSTLAINPFDRYLPNFNLGTAYAKGGLLDDAVAPLKEAISAAPNEEAVCPARANLALDYEKIGDRSAKQSNTTDALQYYALAKSLWDKTSDDACSRSKPFVTKADAAEKRLEKKLQQQQQQQQQQDQNQQQQQDQNQQQQQQQDQNQQQQQQQDQNQQQQQQQQQDENQQQQDQQGQKSETLGDKLGKLQQTDDESQQARDQGDGGSSGGYGTSKPW